MSFRNVNNKLTALGIWVQAPLLLLIRLFWGGSFAIGGIAKFGNIDHVIGYFTSLGIIFPTFNAYLTATVETVGGIFLVLGLASRWAAIPLIGVMLVAYATADLNEAKMIFSDPHAFTHSTPFNFLFACLIIFAFGAGRFSLDRWLAKKESPIHWK
jgi:putative oxidoreductase